MIFGGNIDPYNILLANATNIPVLLMTGFVVQGHKYENFLTYFLTYSLTYSKPVCFPFSFSQKKLNWLLLHGK